MKTLYYFIMIIVGISGSIVLWSWYFLTYDNNSIGSISGIMNVIGTNFSVNYTITNATISSIVNDSHNVITLSLQTKGNGYITMTMPRSILEHKTSTAIEGFGLFSTVSQSEEIDYHVDKKTLNEITFSFPFKKNDNRIIMWLPNHRY